MANGVLARMAPTGIYLLHGVPREVQQAARAQAVRDGTALRLVLLQALREYAAGTWKPQPDQTSSEADNRQPIGPAPRA